MKRRSLKTAWLLGGLALAACEDDPFNPTMDSGGAVSAAPEAGGGPVAALDAGGGGGTTGAGAGGAEAGAVTPVPGNDAGAVPGLDASGAAPDAAVTAGDAGDAASGPGPAPSTGPFPPVTDFAGPGPFTTTVLMNVGPDSNYAVYMPQGAPPAGAKFPLVGWVSGGSTTHDWYELLPHLASHGFVVVSANTISGLDEVPLGQEMIAGIDWVLAENARQGASLFGKIDATKIAASGYSMGSLATFTIANDPRLVTTVHISGGNMAPERIRNLRGPAAFICGTPDPNCTPLDILSEACDIAAANCDLDFQAASTPVFYANFPGGHLGIMTSPHMERIGGMMTAWLRRHLMSDTTLTKMFVGADCTYCKDSNWKVQQKNL